MTGVGRRVSRLVVGAVSALALAALSQLPYVPDPRPDAILRLSWRSRGERIEHCRALTAQEQENLPAHMRQRQLCEGKNAVYRLHATVDGAPVVDHIAQGSGARQRRPIFVFSEVRLGPGRHRIRVEFVRETEPQARGEEREDEEEREAALPLRLALDATLSFEPRQVILVTYDPDRRRLVELHAEPTPTDE